MKPRPILPIAFATLLAATPVHATTLLIPPAAAVGAGTLEAPTAIALSGARPHRRGPDAAIWALMSVGLGLLGAMRAREVRALDQL